MWPFKQLADLWQSYKRRDLTQAEARRIYNILMNSGDEALITSVKEACTRSIESDMGLYGLAMSWDGTELPPQVLNRIREHFSITSLHDRNLLSHDGKYIELKVLSHALPDNIRMQYFNFDMEGKALKHGKSLDWLQWFLIQHFECIHNDGRLEEIVFSESLMDAEDVDIFFKCVGIGGVGRRRHNSGPYIAWGKLAVENIKKLFALKTVPVITDASDKAILGGMVNCTIGGKITLPSGKVVPNPPPGKVWHVNRGVITVVDRPKEE